MGENSPFKCGHIPKRRDWRSIAAKWQEYWDLLDQDIEADQPKKELTRAEENMLFCETYCYVPEGSLVGQKIRLADFQEDFFYSVYDSPTRVKEANLSMARKNAKTGTIALIALVHIDGPEAIRNSRVSSGALSRDQAAEVYNYAEKIVELSPELRGRVIATPSLKRLIGLEANVTYRALSADGSKNHGGSPVVLILDECGQVRGPMNAFIESVVTSQGAYDNPLLFKISTQAPTDADYYSLELDDAERSGDPSIVSHVYAAPEDCKLDDRKAWKAANPAIGLFRSEADIAKQCEKAKRMPSFENSFRNLYLNQRVNMVASFVSPSVWKEGNRKPEKFVGEVFGGLDLSTTTDLTSLVLLNRQDDDLHCQAYFWMPHDSVVDATKRDRAPYDVWVKEGLIKTTPGKVLDYDFIARDIAEITTGLDITKIAFDRWRMDRMKGALDRQAVELELEPFGQGYASMSPAIDALEELLLKGRLAHGGNPPLAMCAANAVVLPDPAGNRKLDKSKSTGRIDGLVALAMAVGVEAMTQEQAPTYSMTVI